MKQFGLSISQLHLRGCRDSIDNRCTCIGWSGTEHWFLRWKMRSCRRLPLCQITMMPYSLQHSTQQRSSYSWLHSCTGAKAMLQGRIFSGFCLVIGIWYICKPKQSASSIEIAVACICSACLLDAISCQCAGHPGADIRQSFGSRLDSIYLVLDL